MSWETDPLTGKQRRIESKRPDLLSQCRVQTAAEFWNDPETIRLLRYEKALRDAQDAQREVDSRNRSGNVRPGPWTK